MAHGLLLGFVLHSVRIAWLLDWHSASVLCCASRWLRMDERERERERVVVIEYNKGGDPLSALV